MRSAVAQGGYTIVEVMIFLAVTSALFLVAMVAINGKQAQAEFTQGARDFHALIDDVINDAANGNFPSKPNIKCNVAGPGAGPVISSGSTEQGTNQDCIYMGKVVKMEQNSKDLKIYAVIGRRQSDDNEDVQNFSEAKPTVSIAPGRELIEAFTIQGDVQPTAVIIKKDAPSLPSANYSAVGFFTSFGSKDTNNNKSGFGDVMVVPLENLLLSDTTGVKVKDAVEELEDSAIISPSAIVICLQQGGSGGKRAAITIGSDGGQTNTDIRLDDITGFVHQALYGSAPIAAGEAVCPA